MNRNLLDVDQPSSHQNFSVRQVDGSDDVDLSEVVRLHALYPHDEEMLRAMGISKEDMAAKQTLELPLRPGILQVSDDGHRMRGLVHIGPALDPCEAGGSEAWTIDTLVLEQEAGEEVASELLRHALSAVPAQVDRALAKIPTTDWAAIRALQRLGFRVEAGEAIAVALHPTDHPLFLNHIRIQSLDLALLDSACRFVNKLCDDEVQKEMDCRLLARALAGILRDPLSRAIAAIDDSGDVVGIATYMTTGGPVTFARQKTAYLGPICVDQAHSRNGLYALMGRAVLKELARAGAEVVTTSVVMSGLRACGRVEALQKMGFRFTQSNLILCRRLEPAEQEKSQWSRRAAVWSAPAYGMMSPLEPRAQSGGSRIQFPRKETQNENADRYDPHSHHGVPGVRFDQAL